VTKFGPKHKTKSNNTLNTLSQVDLKKTLIIIAAGILLIYLVNNLCYTYTPHIYEGSAILFSLFLNFIYNDVKTPLVTKEFVNCLWSINLFLFLVIFGYFSFLINTRKSFKNTVLFFISLFGILAVVDIYLIFPFSTQSIVLITLLKILLLLIIVGVIINIVRLFLQKS
jgi:hypothetical protein